MSWRACLLLAFVFPACACFRSDSVSFAVEIIGQGTVILAGEACTEPRCSFLVHPPAELLAKPADGWRFVGWRGDCEGNGSCAVLAKGSAVAEFHQAQSLRVIVTGGGRVDASDGKSCSGTCEWLPDSKVTLLPVPSPLFQFDGFSGACTGSVNCTVQSGVVTARFGRAVAPVTFEFVGDGAATIQDTVGQFSCTEDCTLQLPTENYYSFRAIPGADTLPLLFSGDCAGTACTIKPPAHVTVQATRGRRLTASVVGEGVLTLNGASYCPGSCEILLPLDAGAQIVAVPSEWSEFIGFDGGCTGTNTCVASGEGAFDVSASFRPLFRTHADLGVVDFIPSESALFVSDSGIVFSATIGSGYLQDGGVVRATPTGNMTVVGIADWAGDAVTAVPLFRPRQGMGSQYSLMRDIAEISPGEYLIVGGCWGDDVDSTPCLNDPSEQILPLAVQFDRNGISRVSVQRTRPAQRYESVLTTRPILRAAVGHYFSSSPRSIGASAFAELDSDLRETSHVPLPFTLGPSYQQGSRCLADASPMTCVMPFEWSFGWNGCSTSSFNMGTYNNVALYTFDPDTFVCSMLSEITVGSWAGGLQTSNIPVGLVRDEADGQLVVMGVKNTDADLTIPPIVQSPGRKGVWLSRFSGNQSTGVAYTAPVRIDQILAARGGGIISIVQAEAATRPPTQYFDRSLSGDQSSVFVAWHRIDGTIKRLWEFKGAAGPATRAARYGGTFVLMLSGSNIAFNGQRLVSDSGNYVHILRFTDPL